MVGVMRIDQYGRYMGTLEEHQSCKSDAPLLMKQDVTIIEKYTLKPRPRPINKLTSTSFGCSYAFLFSMFIFFRLISSRDGGGWGFDGFF